MSEDILSRIEHLERELQALKASLAPLVRLKVAAYNVGFHPESVRQWAGRGLIVAQKVGGRWEVDQGSLIAFVTARRRAGHAE